jgi:hypothetical protein
MRRLLPLAALVILAIVNSSPSFADAESDRVTCFSLGNENYVSLRRGPRVRRSMKPAAFLVFLT